MGLGLVQSPPVAGRQAKGISGVSLAGTGGDDDMSLSLRTSNSASEMELAA